MIASAKCEPDVITETVPLPPYEACEGTSESPTGDYTGSYENTGARALPYNYHDSKTCS